MSATGEELLIVCGTVALAPRAVWTSCACGRQIVHSADLEERARQMYPGRELVFACMTCRAPDLMDPNKLKEMLRHTRKALPGELRDVIDRADPEWLTREIQKLVPQ